MNALMKLQFSFIPTGEDSVILKISGTGIQRKRIIYFVYQIIIISSDTAPKSASLENYLV